MIGSDRDEGSGAVTEATDFSRRADSYLAEMAPGSFPSVNLGPRLVRAANAFTNASEAVHRRRGLRWSAFSALFVLLIYGRSEARAIARLMGTSRQATSLVLSTLERDGKIERQPSADDRRVVNIVLSEQGLATVNEALPDQVRLSEQWFARLDPSEQLELDRLLEKLLVGHQTP
jgi:DNA-binding MarR family transcriptional regulator